MDFSVILQSAVMFAVRLAIAAGVVVLGRYLARDVREMVQEFLDRPQIDAALTESMESVLTRVAYFGTILAAFVVALAIVGVPAAAILSVTSAVLVVMAIALRESLANFAATIMFIIYQPYRVGEEIETLGRRGIVLEIQLFNTVLRQTDRSVATLPNGEIQQDGVINYTRLGISRVDLAFTLRYETDFEQARAIIMDLMTQDPRVLREPPPAVVALEMGEDGMAMQARPFVRYDDTDPVTFGFREAITQRLLAAGIPLAAPRRDVVMAAQPATDPATTS
jgi:small conductance mechanosensitive channel